MTQATSIVMGSSSISHCHQSLVLVIGISHCHQSLSLVIVISHCDQSLSLVIVISYCHQSLSSVIVIIHCHQSLSLFIVISHCHQSLSVVSGQSSKTVLLLQGCLIWTNNFVFSEYGSIQTLSCSFEFLWWFSAITQSQANSRNFRPRLYIIIMGYFWGLGQAQKIFLGLIIQLKIFFSMIPCILKFNSISKVQSPVPNSSPHS